jgi:hypothetical protein
MPTYDINAINGTDVATVYGGIANQAPWLFPMVLFFEYVIIMIGGVYAQNRKIGYSNVPMWGAIAGLTTTTSAFFLSIITGVIDLNSLGICLAVTIGFAVWFFMSDLD